MSLSSLKGVAAWKPRPYPRESSDEGFLCILFNPFKYPRMAGMNTACRDCRRDP